VTAVCLDLQSRSGDLFSHGRGIVGNLEISVHHGPGMGRSAALGLADSSKPEQSAIEADLRGS